MLARREAELIKEGEKGKDTKFMNQLLAETFFDRTIEGIKGIRRRLSHKNRVAQYLADMTASPPSSESDDYYSTEEAPVDQGPDTLEPFRRYISELSPLTTEEFNGAKLQTICDNIGSLKSEDLLMRLELYLRETFPPSRKERKGAKDLAPPKNKREARRAEYAKVQDLWRKDRTRCWKTVEADQLEQNTALPEEVMVPYWKTIMTRNTGLAPRLSRQAVVMDELWRPVSALEIRRAYPERNTAPGPDGMTARMLRSIPLPVLVRIFNIILVCGALPRCLTESRTTLIPKKKGATEPGDFRPITISPVLVRTLHKVLANRLKIIPLDERQRAFREVNGCSDNIFLLDMALRYHRLKHKQMFLTSIDIAKAYDSVTFEALEEVLHAKGLPTPMVDYIMRVYESSTTRLEHGMWRSAPIHPSCGVKQGDPMSCILFNCVIDIMLARIPDDVGVNIDSLHVNIMAFADDMIFMAETQKGMQDLLDVAADYLYTAGLEPNANKCASIAVRTIPKEKKVAIDPKITFQIRGRAIPTLRRSSEWVYLGVPFTPEGRVLNNIRSTLDTKLAKLTKAPLKPQQRLWILRNSVIPSMLYLLTTGAIHIGTLRAMDKNIRQAVRRWLNLPPDCVNAYFHADVSDGGLGIPSLRWIAPLQRGRRLEELKTSSYIYGTTADSFLLKELEVVKRRLTEGSTTYNNSRQIGARWASLLFKSADGKGLRESNRVKHQHNWVKEGTRFLSGRDYLNSIKLRINALPTRSRTTRGRRRDRLCRAGCGTPETLNHILQQCHRTHGMRVRRHDQIIKYVARGLANRNFRVEVEEARTADSGHRKPDIVASRDGHCLVLDAQVVSEQSNLDDANARKIAKYEQDNELIAGILASHDASTIQVLGITLNCRGVWSGKASDSLTSAGVLRSQDMKILSSRVIIGSLAEWWQFDRSTSARPGRVQRTGVG